MENDFAFGTIHVCYLRIFIRYTLADLCSGFGKIRSSFMNRVALEISIASYLRQYGFLLFRADKLNIYIYIYIIV